MIDNPLITKSVSIKMILLTTALVASGCFATGISVLTPVGFPQPLPKVSPTAGVIDMHVQSDSDVFGRALIDTEVSMVAKREGLRGLVLKGRVADTTDRAALAMQAGHT